MLFIKKAYLCTMKERIEHRGIVEHTDGNRVQVRIVQSSACSACEARKMCQSSESKEKIIDCHTGGHTFRPGDEVMVYGSMQMGRDAVIIAFVLPLILVVAWMFAGIIGLGLNELAAIGGMTAILIVYYAIVYCFRGRLSRKFEFQVEPL